MPRLNQRRRGVRRRGEVDTAEARAYFADPGPLAWSGADDPATEYARDVLAGRIMAGRLVRLACQRHVDDLERDDLRWDLPAARHAIGFFRERLRLNGGEFEGKPFDLQPWQAFIVGSLFGWKDLDGYRRFRVAFVEIGKGNGKSPLAAGIGLLLLAADLQRGDDGEWSPEARAEVYAAAVDKDQASILFRDAVAMVDFSPDLDSRLRRSGGTDNVWKLSYNGGFFRPISSENQGRGKSGPRPHGVLLDEVHEHKTSAMVEFMRAGTKGRRQALVFMITNSGFDRQSVCWQHHDYSTKVLERQLPDDTRFAFIAGLDVCDACREKGREFPADDCEDCDDWRDEAVWPKPNPNLDVSIPRKYLREQVREAEGMPAKANIVRRLSFCIWTNQANRAISAEVWDRNRATVPLDRLAGKVCYGGLDLGMTDDLCSLALEFPCGDDPWPVHWWFWMPEEAFKKRAKEGHQPWGLWRELKLVTVTSGAMTDYDFIRAEVGKLAKRHAIRELAIDRWNASHLITQLQQDGANVLTVGQGFQDMTAPTKSILAMLKAGRFAVGGNGLATWQASNLEVAEDAAGNMKPDKASSGDKIDGMSAWANAHSRAILATAVVVQPPTHHRLPPSRGGGSRPILNVFR